MVVKNIYLHSSSNSATAREIRTEDNDIYLNNTAHKTENVNRVQISRFSTFTLTGKEKDPDGLASSTGANSCIRINRPVSIPLTDGKTMMLQSFNSTFNKQYSTVIPDCPGQFQNRDGSWSSKQNFNQYPIGGKRGIPRILIAFPSANDDFFLNTYYNR